MVAWQAMGLPVESKTPPSAASTRERRIMLVAGLLVLLGCGLGFLVHPGFFALAVLTGTGLAFTGWSGLASIFERKDRDL
jgi:hypothetical protein